jgi:hypothetical protein
MLKRIAILTIAMGLFGATGRVALYGIFFDTDKSDLKPES